MAHLCPAQAFHSQDPSVNSSPRTPDVTHFFLN